MATALDHQRATRAPSGPCRPGWSFGAPVVKRRPARGQAVPTNTRDTSAPTMPPRGAPRHRRRVGDAQHTCKSHAK